MKDSAELQALLHAMAAPGLPIIDLGLDRVFDYLSNIGNPHLRLPPVVHVAGTNGKGSTIAFLRAMMEAAGKRVHAYTSPHLVSFRERIVLADKPIDEETLIPLLRAIERDAAPLTFFEATTIAAFQAFASDPADFVLLETGLGGRLDATNVIPNPALCLITPIGYDHQEFLGESLAAIAGEKAGIMKQGVACLSAPQPDEAAQALRAVADSMGVPLRFVSPDADLSLSLAGAHQQQNAALARAAAEVLAIPPSAINQGLAQAVWPARLQRITHPYWRQYLPDSAELWLDGGHNEAAAQAIAAWCKTKGNVTLVLGLMQRKDASAFLTPLAGSLARVIAVPIESSEACHSPDSLAATASMLGFAAETATSVEHALRKAAEFHEKMAAVLVAGSLYLAGNVLEKMA